MTRLGLAYLDARPLASLAQRFLVAARDEMDESVSLAVLEDQWAVFVAWAEAPRIVATGVQVGARLPPHASATGRVLLAGLSDAEVDAVLRASQRQATTANTLTTLQSLRRRVRQTREAGYGYTDEELELGMRTPAVPVRDAQGGVRAAMSVSVFTARVSMTQMTGEDRQIHDRRVPADTHARVRATRPNVVNPSQPRAARCGQPDIDGAGSAAVGRSRPR